jgi:preprotein translocase subunit SecY
MIGRGQASAGWSEFLNYLNQGYWCNPRNLKYTIGMLVYILLIIFFAYFYTSITFNPLQISENMKKSGGFIPGIRPGKPTNDYLTNILNHIIFIGACGLTIISILPFFFNGVFGASVSFGGTSLIIVVSVILETINQIESQMMVRNYKGFLDD